MHLWTHLYVEKARKALSVLRLAGGGRGERSEVSNLLKQLVQVIDYVNIPQLCPSFVCCLLVASHSTFLYFSLTLPSANLIFSSLCYSLISCISLLLKTLFFWFNVALKSLVNHSIWGKQYIVLRTTVSKQKFIYAVMMQPVKMSIFSPWGLQSLSTLSP